MINNYSKITMWKSWFINELIIKYYSATGGVSYRELRPFILSSCWIKNASVVINFPLKHSRNEAGQKLFPPRRKNSWKKFHWYRSIKSFSEPATGKLEAQENWKLELILPSRNTDCLLDKYGCDIFQRVVFPPSFNYTNIFKKRFLFYSSPAPPNVPSSDSYLISNRNFEMVLEYWIFDFTIE